MLTREEAHNLVEKILGYSKFEDCSVSLTDSENCNSRFANNEITSAGLTRDFSIRISSTREARTGSVSVNELDNDALQRAVARSEELASFAPPDPEHVPPLGPQEYPEIPAFDEATARARSRELLPGVQAVIGEAAAKKLNSSGFFTRTASATAFGNKKGNFGYHRRTSASYSATVRTPDGTGSGWAEDEGPRLADIDSQGLGRRAIEKALLSQKPRRLEPGRYTVILEPHAVADLVPLMLSSFSARSADEGRSFLTKRGGGNRLGEKVFAEKVTLRSDPFHPRLPGSPWGGGGGGFGGGGGGGGFFFGRGGGGGWPAQKITWVEKGVVRNLFYDRYWAMKTGRKPTPFPGSIILDGTEKSVEELIRSTERGLLVTHFWYIRAVNPQTVQLTGLTRDGLFWIENGKIAYPVQNFRFNESPVRLLENVLDLGRPQRAGNMLAPAVKAADFNFSSISDAV